MRAVLPDERPRRRRLLCRPRHRLRVARPDDRVVVGDGERLARSPSERAEIGQLPVPPPKGAAGADVRLRHADDVTAVVNRLRNASPEIAARARATRRAARRMLAAADERIAAQVELAQPDHPAVPDEGLSRALADHLAALVDRRQRHVPAAKRAEVGHLSARLPSVARTDQPDLHIRAIVLPGEPDGVGQLPLRACGRSPARRRDSREVATPSARHARRRSAQTD